MFGQWWKLVYYLLLTCSKYQMDARVSENRFTEFAYLQCKCRLLKSSLHHPGSEHKGALLERTCEKIFPSTNKSVKLGILCACSTVNIIFFIVIFVQNTETIYPSTYLVTQKGCISPKRPKISSSLCTATITFGSCKYSKWNGPWYNLFPITLEKDRWKRIFTHLFLVLA